MRVVVVGATGNLGTAVLTRLQAEPSVTEIVGVARRGPRLASPPYGDVEWFTIDVGDDGASDALTKAFEGADAVIHLAWAMQPNHHKAVLERTNVTGTRNVLRSVIAAGVPQVVVASSVGAYSRGPKRRLVDETWRTKGVRRSHYAQHKSANEKMLNSFARAYPDTIVTRMRPGLVLQRHAAAEIIGLFAGRRIPTRWMRHVRPPFLPLSPRFVSQVVHADDVADAFWRAIDRRASGAFNLAAEPIVDSSDVARAFGSHLVPVPYRALRVLVWATWMLRLQKTDPGWLDIAAKVPVMSTERAREVLGWSPEHTAHDTLAEFAHGIANRSNVEASHPLRG